MATEFDSVAGTALAASLAKQGKTAAEITQELIRQGYPKAWAEHTGPAVVSKAPTITNFVLSANPKATRSEVLAAFKNNPYATLNPTEQDIIYWQNEGLTNFDQAVRDWRAQSPSLAKLIDQERAALLQAGFIQPPKSAPPPDDKAKAASTTDNTMLFVGLAAAAVIGIGLMRRRQ